MQTITLIAPHCTCCDDPADLLPREDLGEGLAVCENTGYLYKPNGTDYIPALLPDFPPALPESVQIDLSRVGYA